MGNYEDDVARIKELEEKMYEEYRTYRNLDNYLAMDSRPEWQKSIEELARSFNEKLYEESKNKETSKDDKTEDTSTIQLTKGNINQTKLKSQKKSENMMNKHSTINGNLPNEKKKSAFQKDCLDFDEMIKVELPDKFIPDIHNMTLNSLALSLIEHRKKVVKKEQGEDTISSNDDFNLLLCLLRKKKEQEVEKIAYYSDYNISSEDLYKNDLELGPEEVERAKRNEEKIDNLLKKFFNTDSPL
jgi:hypothetical protein